MYNLIPKFLQKNRMGRSNNNEEEYCVTYHVLVTSPQPYKLFVCYQDSTKYKAFYCTVKEWSKEVRLSSKHVASLSVTYVYDPENGFTCYDNSSDPVNDKELFAPIAISIVHSRTVILKTGSLEWERSLAAFLFPREVI